MIYAEDEVTKTNCAFSAIFSIAWKLYVNIYKYGALNSAIEAITWVERGEEGSNNRYRENNSTKWKTNGCHDKRAGDKLAKNRKLSSEDPETQKKNLKKRKGWWKIPFKIISKRWRKRRRSSSNKAGARKMTDGVGHDIHIIRAKIEDVQRNLGQQEMNLRQKERSAAK